VPIRVSQSAGIRILSTVCLSGRISLLLRTPTGIFSICATSRQCCSRLGLNYQRKLDSLLVILLEGHRYLLIVPWSQLAKDLNVRESSCYQGSWVIGIVKLVATSLVIEGSYQLRTRSNLLLLRLFRERPSSVWRPVVSLESAVHSSWRAPFLRLRDWETRRNRILVKVKTCRKSLTNWSSFDLVANEFHRRDLCNLRVKA
jgi:hypothetical protein